MSEVKIGRINPRVILEAFQYRWKIPFVMMIVVTGVAVGARAIMKPKVKMSSQLLIQDNTRANPFSKDISGAWPVKNQVPLITAIVKSGTTLERVLRQLGEVDDTMSTSEIGARVQALRVSVDVWGEGANLIRITAVGRSPERVYAVLTTMTEAIVDEMLAPQKAGLDESVAFLKDQLTRVESELDDLEQKVAEFKQTHATALPELHKLNLEVHLRLTNSLVDTESTLVAAQQRIRLAEQRLLRYDPQSAKLREEATALKRQLRTLLRTYTSIHPRVRAVQNKLRAIDEKLTVRQQRRVVLDISELEEHASPEVDVESTRTDGVTSTDIVIRADDVLTSDLLTYQAAASEVESLSHKLTLLRARAQGSMDAVRAFATNEQALNRLLRDLETKGRIYANLLQRLGELQVTRELTQVEASKQVWVVDEPVGPAPIARLPLWLVLAAGPIIGLMLAIGLIGVLEFLDPTVRSVDEAIELAEAPALGTLPWLDTESRQAG